MELEQPITAMRENATQHTKASLYTYFGDALFRLKYFRRALRAFEQALSFNDTSSRRASKRCKTISSLSNNCDISKKNLDTLSTSEYELKLRIHFCHMELKEHREAMMILDKIPAIERNVKINMALADLYHQERNYTKAKELYIEVLKQDPLRLDLVVKLLKLHRIDGHHQEAIIDLIPDDVRKACPWYVSWIQAQTHLYSHNSKQAIKAFGSLTSRFESRASILTGLAEACYHDGNFREAVRIFQIAYNSDPLTLSGVGSYAACLHKESSKESAKRTLEDLAISMSAKCNIEGEYFHEPWLALAHYYASIDKKEPKALLFVQKAYKLDRYSIETLILLACLCIEKKDPSKALNYIMTAKTQAPYRYEVQRIVCDSFFANNKKTQAVSYARLALELLGRTARAHYLYADIILKSNDQRRKGTARLNLQSAIKLDPTYLPAVFAYADLLIAEKKFDEATEVLENALHHHHSDSPELHKYLYTCYSEKKDNDKALYHQNLASDHNITSKVDQESLQRGSQETITQDDVGSLLGLEADEPMDHGDSEVDDTNLDS